MSRLPPSYIVVLALLGASLLLLAFTVDVSLQDEPGVRMTLPADVGAWRGEEILFCHKEGCRRECTRGEAGAEGRTCPACGEALFPMSWEECEALPKDTQFVKSRYTNGAGDQLFASIVLTGRERESIHRPERCLVGQGYTIMDRYVLDVPIEDGRRVGVTVIRTHKMLRAPDREIPYHGYYAYWFVGQNRETPSHYWRMFWLAWDRVVHSVAHKWAYISIGGRRAPEGSDYEDEIREIVAGLHDRIVLKAPPDRGG
jgi:hypothetical protein